MNQVEKIKIFLGSPSDVTSERKRVQEVIHELNQSVAPSLGVVLDLTTSARAFPGFGKDGQAIINEQIGDMQTYDLFVAIFWNRIGTPTSRDISGTVEEFKRALKALQTKKKPQIWTYFSNAPANLSTSEELEQKKGVIAFRNSIRKKGLRKDYQNVRDFATQFRIHLTTWLHEHNKSKQKPVAPRKTSTIGEILPKPKTSPTRATKKKAAIVKNPGTWVMLKNRFYKRKSLTVQNDGVIVLQIASTSLEELDELRELQSGSLHRRAPITFAHQFNAGTASVQSISADSLGSTTTFTITIAPTSQSQNNTMFEFSYSNYSANDIAHLRAQWILLGKPLPEQIAHLADSNQSRRSETEIVDTLPRLWATLKTDIRSFPQKAWLYAIYLLKTSNIVESIQILELDPIRNNTMKLRFKGRRQKVYSNQEPAIIVVEGECRLEI